MARRDDEAWHAQVSAFFADYGRTVASGDLPGIAARYAYPALVLGDNGTIPVAEAREVEAAFTGAAEGYRARGLVEAHATVVAVEPLTASLAIADVRWEYRDAGGTTHERSRYRYIIRHRDDAMRIQVVIQTATGNEQ